MQNIREPETMKLTLIWRTRKSPEWSSAWTPTGRGRVATIHEPGQAITASRSPAARRSLALPAEQEEFPEVDKRRGRSG